MSSDRIAVNRHHISLPWATAGFLVAGVVSGTGVYYALKGEVADARAEATTANDYAKRVEFDGKERDSVFDRRLTKLEDSYFESTKFMARIDERIAAQTKVLDSIQRDLNDLKMRRP